MLEIEPTKVKKKFQVATIITNKPNENNCVREKTEIKKAGISPGLFSK
jgi:hypothetical protein